MEKPCCSSCATGKKCQGEIHTHKTDNYMLKSSKHHHNAHKIGKAETHNHSMTHKEREDLSDDGDDDYVNAREAINQISSTIEKKRVDENKVDFIEDTTSVIQAILRPDLYKNIGFPNFFSTPGIPAHKMNTLVLKTNNNGVAWAEVNFGQYLESTTYTATPLIGATNGRNDVGGVSLGRSNVFAYDPVLDGGNLFTGDVTYNNTSSLSHFFTARDTLRESLSLYNAVRAGPAAIWYDFTGRLDTSSGVVTCGINYTFAVDNLTAGDNGFLPDLNFTTQKSIEDCPYRVQTSVVNSVHGIFLPHDSEVMNLKGVKEGHKSIVQRFFIIITGAAKNEVIGQLKIATNFDAKPTAQLADNISTQITKSPSIGSLKDATDYLIKNNLVLRVAKDQGYGIMRFAQS